MMKITSAHVWVGRRHSMSRDKLSQIVSFDEQSALICAIPPISPPSYSTCTDNIIFCFCRFHYPFEPSARLGPNTNLLQVCFQLAQPLVVNIDSG